LARYQKFDEEIAKAFELGKRVAEKTL